MKSIIKLGLIGVGGFGRLHLEAIRKLEKAGAVKLIAVADPNIQLYPDLLAELRSRHVRFYEDYSEMLVQEPNIKAVSIAAPIPFHFEMVKKCLEHDLFVYLEKPPVPLLGQLDELIHADVKCRVTVGFQMVESIWSQQIKSWIVSGKLGEVREIRVGACWPRVDDYYNRARWAGRMKLGERPVFDGPATNALAHLIHNVMFFAGSGTELFDKPARIQGELYRARPVESYDAACMRGHFDSGISFSAALTHATKEFLPYQMKIVGTKGWACVSNDGSRLESNLESPNCVESVEALLSKSFIAFIDYVRGESRRPPTLLQDVRGYTLATNAMLVSSGGIHDIGELWCRRIENGKDGIYAVDGLHSAISDSIQNPQLFSELDLPWAIKTSAISTEQIKNSDVLVAMKSTLSNRFTADQITSSI